MRKLGYGVDLALGVWRSEGLGSRSVCRESAMAILAMFGHGRDAHGTIAGALIQTAPRNRLLTGRISVIC
jgi:hypothetical protein